MQFESLQRPTRLQAVGRRRLGDRTMNCEGDVVRMKSIYRVLIFLVVVIVVALFVIPLVWCTVAWLSLDQKIQSVAILVAVGASIVAIGVADPKPRVVKASVELLGFSNGQTYSKGDLSPDIAKGFGDAVDRLRSCRVNLRIRNQSGFTWSVPQVTLRLPAELEPPDTSKDSLKVSNAYRYDMRSFRTNMYNSLYGFVALKNFDSVMMSNSNLPYLNDGESLDLWVRLLTPLDSSKCVRVHVYINCEKAEGYSTSIEIDPSSLDCSDGDLTLSE